VGAVDEFEDAEEADHWDILYMALSCLGKVFGQYPALLQQVASVAADDARSTAFWPALQGHLLFSHSWVRAAACGVYGQAFASSGGANDVGLGFLADNAAAFSLSQQLCKQLQGKHITPEFGDQVRRLR